ncbi:MAG TPA: ABC transporter permease [Xanthomonadaceae bacterium]|nr:ABC transporter permease [Xanthomonadaceae bacterium]
MNPSILMREVRGELLSAIRQPAFVLPTLAFPVMFYLFFGLAFTMSRSMHMPTWLLATYGVFGIIAPALFGFGIMVATEKGEGWLRLKRAAPVSPLVPLLARVAMAMLFAFLVFVLLASLGALFGGVRMPRADWILLAVTLTAGSIPFCAMGLACGLWLSARAAPAVINLVYLPMAFLSGLWVPLPAFPEWMQGMANVLPPYHLAAIALHVVGMQPAENLWLHAWVLTGVTMVFLAVAAVAWRHVQEN